MYSVIGVLCAVEEKAVVGWLENVDVVGQRLGHPPHRDLLEGLLVLFTELQSLKFA
jgi:hypothetical protein